MYRYIMMRRRTNNRQRHIWLAVFVLIATAIFSMHRSSAIAGPVTGGSGVWPYVKLGIYQGVAALSVNGTSVIELGANGKDIATGSPSAIAIRPNAVSAANAAIFTSANGGTRLKVPGSVCLYPSGVGAAAVCNNSWPAGSSSLWTTSVDVDGFTSVTPLPVGSVRQGVLIGSTTSRVTSGTAVAVQQDVVGELITAVRSTNMNGTALAAQLTGDAQIAGNFWVRGTWTINTNEVYHGASISAYTPDSIVSHDGIGSGLDADTLDGYDVTILPGNKCNGLACLCFTFGVGNVRCAKLRNIF